MKPASAKPDYFPLALQISEQAWADYDLSLELLNDPEVPPLYRLRRLAGQMQQRRPEPAASGAQLNLLALLNTAFREVAGRYLKERRCAVGLETVTLADRQVAVTGLRPTLAAFVRLYPPVAVRHGAKPATFLLGEAAANLQSTVVELFLLAVQSRNSAARPMAGLFADDELQSDCGYRKTVERLDAELAGLPLPGLLGGSLLALLQRPLLAAPGSLSGQLDYVLQQWGALLPPELLRRMRIAFDVLTEEDLRREGGPGPSSLPRFAAAGEEPERFSSDTDWMPKVVLVAKTIYVWLDQLSRRYGRTLTRLDQIPEEELDRLSGWGFTSLWLIGIWERSPASQQIKQMMGNPEAVASAYSLYDYVVAEDLGGEAALQLLEARCATRGLRLACDVVPNHTGIDSRWTREHPDWYVQVAHPPYPAYRFSGPDLCRSEEAEICIEDGYWNRSDAAVVFRHVERRSGQVRYLYHGNDGTHLPWNDTAQLNFLLPEVREAMIQTILQVARRFRIIRFDAAMTLAKKHYQRLWFPLPGGGAGVPSRAEHAMNGEDFERAFPVEFWREVVDRVAAEVPDTLLLAEAFWLMEGYFVRTLGMHRVYNSAFMNMLKMEENAKYRSVLKNILEFNHEILKRFVNFMNNPDEATAVAQFGKGDKYFAVATLLVTMPGLPMFGHGQVEGLEEKYGMEYRRAYWDETPDAGFIEHHEAQVFPLMRRRHLFSDSAHFVLYDFFSDGHVNEDVIAYSNRCGDERTLVVVHNRHADTGGWLRESAAKRVRDGGGEHLARPPLAAALGLRDEAGLLYRFRDHRSGQEYLRPARELAGQGLYLQLGPYQYHVFLDFREVADADGSWGRLAAELDGRPVGCLETEWKRRRYAGLLGTLRRALRPDRLAQTAEELAAGGDDEAERDLFCREVSALYAVMADCAGLPAPAEEPAARLAADLAALQRLLALPEEKELFPGREELARVLLPWLALRHLGSLAGADDAPRRTGDWLETYLLRDTLEEVLRPQGGEEAWRDALLVALLCRHQEEWAAPEDWQQALAHLLDDSAARALLGWHGHGNAHWVARERFEELLITFLAATAVAAAADPQLKEAELSKRLAALHAGFERLRQQAAAVHYQVEKFAEFV